MRLGEFWRIVDALTSTRGPFGVVLVPAHWWFVRVFHWAGGRRARRRGAIVFYQIVGSEVGLVIILGRQAIGEQKRFFIVSA
jgi:hypothetical protein